ncbi:hypothetical protein BAX55_18670 [Acinetobacter baumannii]|uniref:DUF2523 family protein n=1 Tax=Acinetobacter baumannii TaxID=470 RepID=UPI0007EE451E|nr:DUF2523 family protein [Acinetobacter baumannii]OBS04258.1 hypothetical protein BAX55_18670 [Acinetobacter baumannii]
MSALFYKLLDVFANNFIRQFLTSMGIGLAVGLPFYLMLSTYVDRAVAQINSAPYLGLMAVFGIDKAMSIILTAILTRAYWESMKLRAVKRGS